MVNATYPQCIILYTLYPILLIQKYRQRIGPEYFTRFIFFHLNITQRSILEFFYDKRLQLQAATIVL